MLKTFRPLVLPLVALLMASCATTSDTGTTRTDSRPPGDGELPAIEASPGLEDWGRMGEIGVAFGAAIAPKVFDGLSTADKASLLRFSRASNARDGEFATLRYAAPNGWTYERMFLRGDPERRCNLYEFRATRGAMQATGYALGCQTRGDLLLYSVTGADVSDQALIDHMLGFVPDARLMKVVGMAAADSRFEATPPPSNWEALGARRAQWRKDFRENAPILVERPAASG